LNPTLRHFCLVWERGWILPHWNICLFLVYSRAYEQDRLRPFNSEFGARPRNLIHGSAYPGQKDLLVGLFVFQKVLQKSGSGGLQSFSGRCLLYTIKCSRFLILFYIWPASNSNPLLLQTFGTDSQGGLNHRSCGSLAASSPSRYNECQMVLAFFKITGEGSLLHSMFIWSGLSFKCVGRKL
jgi:hypothetical protein